MKLLKPSEQGRSMIEMLGVLAIVGILSVGGISGFSKAMTTHKQIKLSEEYNQFFMNILQYKDSFKKLFPNNEKINTLIPYLTQMPDTIPKGWSSQNTHIYDSMGGQFSIYIKLHKLRIDYVFKQDIQYCRLLFTNTLLQFQDAIEFLYLYRKDGENGAAIQGSNYCTNTSTCLNTITINEIMEICSGCPEDLSCSLTLSFD